MLEIVKRYLIDTLDNKRLEIVPDTPPEYKNIIADSVHASLNIISLSDAMYHDVEHTCLVTLCGQEIFCGKKVKDGNLNSKDWLHFTISLLFHDIGYVKNILPNDDGNYQIINEAGDKVSLESGQTDASLTPYHVERGKMYINQRSWPEYVDKKILMDLISFTQFPQPERGEPKGEDEEKFFALANLVGSADLIGQLADPMYDEKIPRLFYEFKESGTSDKMGYKSSQDLRVGFPSFFINFVRPNIQDALDYLQITEEGRSWIAGLNYHVFSQSHKASIEKSGLSLITKLADLNISVLQTEKFIETILEAVCDYSGWPIGHAYKVENVKNGIKLRSTGVWYTTIPEDELKQFIKISEEYEFKSGEGLPGRVYQVGSVQTIYDVTKDDNFPRANLARDVGVRGAFSFPIKNGEEILYILEFFSVEPELISPPVIELMRQLSVQISRKFMQND
tara:strand:+ start:35185 stop:36537 length:1353 start_codon:yes stop_codon:yes gene_type:complete